MSLSQQDQERRTRIIDHMNKDHTRELGYYLRHFCHVSRSIASQSPRVTDIALDSMTVTTTTSHQTYTVPFSPPLSSWDEIRPRVVAMDEEARRALNISDIRVTEHRWPDKPFDITIFSAVLFYWFCLATLPIVQPGSVPWQALKATLGSAAPQGYRWLVKALIAPVFLIHSVEAYLFYKKRMQRHGVDAFSGLWWKWMFCVFIEGLTSWQRIDRIVGEATKEKEKATKSH